MSDGRAWWKALRDQEACLFWKVEPTLLLKGPAGATRIV